MTPTRTCLAQAAELALAHRFTSTYLHTEINYGPDDKEQFRIYMRMMENFSGCRVQAYCIMCNHFHILLEVPARPKALLTDEQLL